MFKKMFKRKKRSFILGNCKFKKLVQTTTGEETLDAGTNQVTRGVSGISSKTGSSAENWSANWSMKGCTWVSLWSSPYGMESSMMMVLSMILDGAFVSTLAFLVRECFWMTRCQRTNPNKMVNHVQLWKTNVFIPLTFVLISFWKKGTRPWVKTNVNSDVTDTKVFAVFSFLIALNIRVNCWILSCLGSETAAPKSSLSPPASSPQSLEPTLSLAGFDAWEPLPFGELSAMAEPEVASDSCESSPTSFSSSSSSRFSTSSSSSASDPQSSVSSFGVSCKGLAGGDW